MTQNGIAFDGRFRHKQRLPSLPLCVLRNAEPDLGVSMRLASWSRLEQTVAVSMTLLQLPSMFTPLPGTMQEYFPSDCYPQTSHRNKTFRFTELGSSFEVQFQPRPKGML